MRTKLTTSVIFLGAGTSTAWLLVQSAPASGDVLTVAPVVGFLLAAGLIFWRPWIGYDLGLLSGFWALHWFWNIEFGYFQH